MAVKRSKPGMSVRECVEYVKSNGKKCSIGAVEYWLKKGMISRNRWGRIDKREVDYIWDRKGMTVRQYVEYRKNKGWPGSNRSVSERERLGYIFRNEDELIDPEQADFFWHRFHSNMPCHRAHYDAWFRYCHEKKTGDIYRRY